MGLAISKRILLVAALLVLLCTLAQGQFYIFEKRAIEIDIDQSGNASISERFFMRFQNQLQLDDFRQTVGELGIDFDAWRQYDERIHTSIGGTEDTVVSRVSFQEQPTTYLEINYSLKEPIVQKKLETSRTIDYILKTKFFTGFIEGSLWVIPEKTEIMVNLPSGVELQQPVEPEAAISGNSVTWAGRKYSNTLTLGYRQFKQIASFDFREALDQLMQSDVFWVFVTGAIVLGIILFSKRKGIAARVENYIVEHSDLSSGEEE